MKQSINAMMMLFLMILGTVQAWGTDGTFYKGNFNNNPFRAIIAIPTSMAPAKLSEDYDGEQWQYKTIDSLVVGMNVVNNSCGYGKYYQVALRIENQGSAPIAFAPEQITGVLTRKGKEQELELVSKEKFLAKVKKVQNIMNLVLGAAAITNAGDAAEHDDFHKRRSRIGKYFDMVAVIEDNINTIKELSVFRDLEKEVINCYDQGYLDPCDIAPQTAMSGFINLKYKKGEKVQITVPVDGKTFVFDWDESEIQVYDELDQNDD